VALAINLTVPPAVVLLEMEAAAKHQQVTTGASEPSAVFKGLNAGLKLPLLWGPILGIVVLAGIHLPIRLATEMGVVLAFPKRRTETPTKGTAGPQIVSASEEAVITASN
jgi:hypothetical protein